MPFASVTVRCVVDRCGPSVLSVGSPGGTAPGCAFSGSISAARSSAKLCDSRPASGTR